MGESTVFYTQLADRESFNASVRHINRTLDILDACGPKKNIADEINTMLTEKMFSHEQTQAVANMLLVEKWKYSVMSSNVSAVQEDTSKIVQEVSKWKALDLVIGYHHPDIGFIMINPKNPESAAIISGFRKNELVVLYAGVPEGNEAARKNSQIALPLLLKLIEGKQVTAPASLLSGSYSFVPAKKPVVKKQLTGKKGSASASKTSRSVSSSVSVTTNKDSSSLPLAEPTPIVHAQSRMTPLISVIVSNELFHNGNVEAWKRIIRSYNARYPNLEVFIYYDGERIVDINTLFKWGKVKHGSCIQFCVSGENIQDLAKLSRYFKQGASPQFEAFLHGSPDSVMNLF